jgi:hypothetical protein
MSERFVIRIKSDGAEIEGMSWKELYNYIAREFNVSTLTAELVINAFIDSHYEGELTAQQSKLLEYWKGITRFLKHNTKVERDPLDLIPQLNIF